MEAIEDKAVIFTLATRLEADPCRKRWQYLPLPKEVIKFDSSQLDINTVILAALGSLKTFNGKKISFLADKDLEYI